MNNLEIIKAVEEIVCPHFCFNIEDFYGDKGSCVYPEITEMTTLVFKLDGKRNQILPKHELETMVHKIKCLNVGSVEIMTIQSFGKYIVVTPK